MWKYIKDPMKEICEAQPTSREILQEINAKHETQLRAIAGLHEQFENQKITVSEAQIQEKVAEVEKQVKPQRQTEVAELEMSLSEAQTTSENAQAECRKYKQMFSNSEKERKILEMNSQCVIKLKKELQDEKQMNECLRSNQEIWQEKVAALEKHLKEVEAQRKTEVTELQEQVGDLMRHFEAQTAIENAPADLQQEIQEGQLHVTVDQPGKSKKKSKKRK
jgi:BRCA1-associated protein